MEVFKAAWNGFSYVCHAHPELCFVGGIAVKCGFDALFKTLSVTNDPIAMIEALLEWLSKIKRTLDEIAAKVRSRLQSKSKYVLERYMDGLGMPDPTDMDDRYERVLTYVVTIKNIALRMTWRDDKGQRHEIFASIKTAQEACGDLDKQITSFSKTVQTSLWPCPDGTVLMGYLSETRIKFKGPLPPP